jgi:hypothetical protein
MIVNRSASSPCLHQGPGQVRVPIDAHGGWNSISKSLAQGVPIICWPMSHGDQFTDAVVLSSGEEPLAFELLQVCYPIPIPSLPLTSPFSFSLKFVGETC